MFNLIYANVFEYKKAKCNYLVKQTQDCNKLEEKAIN